MLIKIGSEVSVKKLFCKVSLMLGMAVSMTIAHAASTPTAFLDKAKVIATGKDIRIYRMPTKDVNGKIKYYDVNLSLGISETGIPASIQIAKVTESPEIATNLIQAGSYIGPSKERCTVNVATIDGGRNQYNLICTNTTNFKVLNATWFSGPVAGHPLNLELISANLHRTGTNTSFLWGKVINDDQEQNGWWNCLATSDLINASQVGNTIQISNFHDDATNDCGVVLTKTTP